MFPIFLSFFSLVVGSEFSIILPALTHIPFIVCSFPKMTEEVAVGVIFLRYPSQSSVRIPTIMMETFHIIIRLLDIIHCPAFYLK
jgi:hypothetical protein